MSPTLFKLLYLVYNDNINLKIKLEQTSSTTTVVTDNLKNDLASGLPNGAHFRMQCNRVLELWLQNHVIESQAFQVST